MEDKARDDLSVRFGAIVSEAGSLILAIPVSAAGASRKPDGSPVSRADVDAEKLILARLAPLLPGVPVIAEESFASGSQPPERFLLVDPLDGTREFLAGHKDYTVNIALIEAGVPVVGAICAPASAQVFVGGARAFQAPMTKGGAITGLTAIGGSAVPATGLRAVVSRSHLDAGSEQWMREHAVADLQRVGSSLKFCLLTRGDADVYPRLAPTMEWDIAAGHAILNAAGGCVLDKSGSPLRYGKTQAGFKNPGFIAWGRRPAD